MTRGVALINGELRGIMMFAHLGDDIGRAAFDDLLSDGGRR